MTAVLQRQAHSCPHIFMGEDEVLSAVHLYVQVRAMLALLSVLRQPRCLLSDPKGHAHQICSTTFWKYLQDVFTSTEFEDGSVALTQRSCFRAGRQRCSLSPDRIRCCTARTGLPRPVQHDCTIRSRRHRRQAMPQTYRCLPHTSYEAARCGLSSLVRQPGACGLVASCLEACRRA